MEIGIGSYAMFWEWHDAPTPLPIAGMLERAAELGCDVFEICDDPRIERCSATELASIRSTASALGLRLQLGTRGIGPSHLARLVDIADALDARVLRSMVQRHDGDAGIAHVADTIALTIPALEARGIALALETYEQVPTSTLVGAIERLGSPRVGVCLDPANCVAALEVPADVIAAAAPHTLDLHVKDFQFTRQEGWVGFQLTGARIGSGLLDLPHELSSVRAAGREPAAIVEHWLPWQGDSATTVALERDWTDATLAALRASTLAPHEPRNTLEPGDVA